MSAPIGLCARLVSAIGSLPIEIDLATGGGTLALVGPNGAGKSSVLSLLLGALPVAQGRISVGSAVLLDTQTGVNVPVEQRQLGYVPQEYALFPHLTVRQNLFFALGSSPRPLSRAVQAERADSLLHELGLGVLGSRWPRSLSGGEKQRVALARALCVRPRALLLDEPLAALDIHARREVREFLEGYLEKVALPTLLVTHDPLDARRLGHRIAVLEGGKVTQTGTWDELSQAPTTRFVQEFTRP